MPFNISPESTASGLTNAGRTPVSSYDYYYYNDNKYWQRQQQHVSNHLDGERDIAPALINGITLKHMPSQTLTYKPTHRRSSSHGTQTSEYMNPKM